MLDSPPGPLVLLLVLVPSALPARPAAQDPVLRPDRKMMSAGVALWGDQELADLDGDGDLDLVQCTRYDPAPPRVYLYDGLAGYRELPGAFDAAAATNTQGVAVLGDFDGDGNVDAYRGTFAGGAPPVAQQVFLGDGTGKLTLLPGATTWVGRSLAVGAADLNLDGFLDAVSDDSTAGTSALNVHVNSGAAVFSTFQVPLPFAGAGQVGDVALGDVDADGLADAVLATGGDQLLVRNGPHLGLAYAPGAIPGGYPGSAVELGDVDGDGDLDLVCGNGFLSVQTEVLDTVLLGDGAGSFAQAAFLPIPAQPTKGLALHDLDGDGDLDVVLGVTHFSPTKPAAQLLLRNDGGLVFSAVAGAIATAGDLADVVAGDVDQDGDVDLVLASDGMEQRLLLGDGALGFAEASTALPISGSATDLLLADLDGDGDPDAWTSSAAGQVQRNPGNGVLVPDPAATAGVVLSGAGTEQRAVALDADGDGALDVYQTRGDALQDALYANTGAGVFAKGGTYAFRSRMAAAGDVDGDGDADLVLAHADVGSSHADALLTNDGSGAFVSRPGGLPTLPNPSMFDLSDLIALADLDLDGDLDVVRGYPGKPASWNAGTGVAGPFGAETPISAAIPARDLQTADLDADGDPDLLFATSAGPVLLRNDLGGAFTDVSVALPAHAFSLHTRLAVGDVDGDADPDIVLNDYSATAPATYVVYHNQGGGAFLEATASIQQGLPRPRALALGDVDGDQDVDVVGLESSNGRLRLLANHARQLAWRGLPRAGKGLALDVGGPASEVWFLATSPGQTSLPLPPFGVLHLHPTGLLLVASGVLDTLGQAAVAATMPAGPSAVGLTVFTQALVGTSAPRFTNLEIVTLTAY